MQDPMQDPMQDIVDAIASDIASGADMRGFADRLPFPESGYAVQDAVVAKLAKAGPVGGYKIAWNLPALMQKFRIGEPAAACVFAKHIRHGHAVLRQADYTDFMIEPEITAILGAPIGPRVGGHDRASVAAAVALFVPSFELLDRRAGDPSHPPSIIANNIFNQGAAIGGPGRAPAEIDFDKLETVVEQDGAEILRQTPAWPMNPLDSLVFVANHFNARGVTLAKGAIVLCGAHTPLIPITGAGRMTMRVTGLGEASFEIA
jgi:2-keto-4-pentenoate hydratase